MQMNLSVRPLIQDLEKKSLNLEKIRKSTQALEVEVNQISNLRKKLTQDLKTDNKLNWENEEKRALLDSFYNLDAFKAHEKIYRFNSAQEALPLLQEIDQYYSEKFDHLKLEKNALSQKQSNLEQYHQEILRIISQLSQCMSILNR